MSLFQFLRASQGTWKALAAHSPLPKVNIVIGNEAGDADSMISAITYAYFRQASSAVGAGEVEVMHVPFISCKRADFNLRREASHLLDLARESECGAGADAALDSELLFLDDLDMHTVHTLARQSKLQISLVDHNKLTGQLAMSSGLDECVCDIIDHHRDMNAHPVRDRIMSSDMARVCKNNSLSLQHVSGGNRLISFDESIGRGVGSTCTLVAQLMLQWKKRTTTAPAAPAIAAVAQGPWVRGTVETASSSSFSSVRLASEEPEADRLVFDRSPSAVLNEVSAALLSGVILLDTINLDPAAGKTTQLDVETVRQLADIVEFRTRKTFDGGYVIINI
jgi:inorganic pyrophosphatase/exopolyphosphatase